MRTYFFKPILEAVKLWFVPLLIGIIFLIVGIVVLSSPLNALVSLSILFSISFLFGGIAEIIFALQNRKVLENWGWQLTMGIFTLLIGILLLRNPELSVKTLSLFVGFLIMFRGIAAISFSLDIKRYGGRNWGWLLASGIIGTIISFILIGNFTLAGMFAVIFVGMSFIFGGVFNVIFSFQLRKIHRRSKKISEKLKERYHALHQEIEDIYWEEIEE